MQEKIYTLPINDAFDQPCACPLCQLEDALAQKQVDYYLSPAMMEPDTRLRCNSTGFCGAHWQALYEAQKNRLTLGLILSTQLPSLASRLEQSLDKALPQASSPGLFRKKNLSLERLANELDALSGASCLICAAIEETMDHYARVICRLFAHENTFREKLEQRDICLPHLALLTRAAAKHLKKIEGEDFVRTILARRLECMKTLEGEVLWFTQKFDYRNQDAPWKESKDALPRAIASIWGGTSPR